MAVSRARAAATSPAATVVSLVSAAMDHPGGRPGTTGRRLAYLPAALLGNGSLLVTLSARGEVERMLWPHVDGPDNVAALRLGAPGARGIRWLDELPAVWRQAWDGDASVLRTTVSDAGGGDVEIVDVADPDEPVLVRRVETAAGTLVVSVEPLLEGVVHATGAFVDPATGIVVLHRRRAALAIGVDRKEARADVRSVGGVGDDVAHVSPLEARLEVEHDGVAHVVAAFGATPFEALARARRHLGAAGDAVARRARADALLLARTAVGSGESDLDRLLRRSVLVLEQLADRATGAIVAAPEMDEGFVESGGYGFVWPRDLAYVVLGLVAARCDEAAAAALRWLARVQAPEGLWLHRYWTTGEPAPSWGLHQIDETGVVLLAVEAAFREIGDEELDRELWPVVRRAAELLVTFVDPATGLPRASTDLWEQHEGQHAYSTAAVAGGLRAASLTAARREPSLQRRYSEAAADVAAALDVHLWDDELGRYRRAVNVARPDDAGGPGRSGLRAWPPVPQPACRRCGPRRRSPRQRAPRPRLAVRPVRCVCRAGARDGGRRRRRAHHARGRHAQARARRLRGRARVAARHALARARTASPRERRGQRSGAGTRHTAADHARPAPGAGARRRHAGVGPPARLEPRDAARRGTTRARGAPHPARGWCRRRPRGMTAAGLSQG